MPILAIVETKHKDKVVVVYNPVKVDEGHLRKLVNDHAPDDVRIEWVETTKEDSGYAQATAAAQAGARMVMAAGGDGTVRIVASALAGTEVALGVIPAGTGNLLARNLYLDLDLDASVKRAFSGVNRTIDMCEARLHWEDNSNDVMRFAVIAGVGGDAQMIAYTGERLKKRIGPLAYAPGLFRTLGRGNRISLKCSVDGVRMEKKRVHTLMIGNCGDMYSSVPLLPHAKLDDGKLDVVAFTPLSFFDWFRIGGYVARNTVERLRSRNSAGRDDRMDAMGTPSAMTIENGERVTIAFDYPEILEIDGDPVGKVSAVEIEIKPASLVVRV